MKLPDGNGNYECSTCGTKMTFLSSVCPNCEQNRLLKENLNLQEEQINQSRQMARTQEQQNTYLQAEQQMQVKAQQEQIAAANALEEIKNNFAEIILLIHTKDENHLEQAINEWCNKKTQEAIAKNQLICEKINEFEIAYDQVNDSIEGQNALKEIGNSDLTSMDQITLDSIKNNLRRGEFTESRAKAYKTLFTDYIIKNSSYAKQISIAIGVLDVHIKKDQAIDFEVDTHQNELDQQRAIADEIDVQKSQSEADRLNESMEGSLLIIVVVLIAAFGGLIYLFSKFSLFR